MGRGWTEAYGSHCKLPVNTDGSDRNQIFVYFFPPTVTNILHTIEAGVPALEVFPFSSFCALDNLGSQTDTCCFFSLYAQISLSFSPRLDFFFALSHSFDVIGVCSPGCGHGQEVCTVSLRAALKSKQDMCYIPRDPQERLQSAVDIPLLVRSLLKPLSTIRCL